MSEFIIVITSAAIFQSILSIILIMRRKNNIAIVSEIITSFALFCALNLLPFEIDLIKLKIIGLTFLEYFAVKVFLVLFFIAIRKYSFYSIKKLVSRKKKNPKKLKRLRKLYRVEYWPKLKLGLPEMANRTDKKTGVKFDSKGFPKFKSYYTVTLRRKYFHRSRERHSYYANRVLYKHGNDHILKMFSNNEIKMLALGHTPSSYIWHHHQDAGVLQLVKTDIHSETPHVGGYSIWGGKK